MKLGTKDGKSGTSSDQTPPLLPLSPLRGERDGSSWAIGRGLSKLSERNNQATFAEVNGGYSYNEGHSYKERRIVIQ